MHNGILFVYKKNEVMNFSGTWVEMEKIYCGSKQGHRKTNPTCFLSPAVPSSKSSDVNI